MQCLSPKGVFGKCFPCLKGVNGSTEQEPSVAVNPEAMPWVAGLVAQIRRRRHWDQMSKRQPQWGCCGSARVRGHLWCDRDPQMFADPQALGCLLAARLACLACVAVGTPWLLRLLAGKGHRTEKLSRFCSHEEWCLGKKDA